MTTIKTSLGTTNCERSKSRFQWNFRFVLIFTVFRTAANVGGGWRNTLQAAAKTPKNKQNGKTRTVKHIVCRGLWSAKFITLLTLSHAWCVGRCPAITETTGTSDQQDTTTLRTQTQNETEGTTVTNGIMSTPIACVPLPKPWRQRHHQLLL